MVYFGGNYTEKSTHTQTVARISCYQDLSKFSRNRRQPIWRVRCSSTCLSGVVYRTSVPQILPLIHPNRPGLDSVHWLHLVEQISAYGLAQLVMI